MKNEKSRGVSSGILNGDNRKVVIIAILLFLLLLIFVIIFVLNNSSTSNELKDYDMSNVSLSSEEITYDGQEHSLLIDGTLPDGVSVNYTYDGNDTTGETEVGEYNVVASFEGDNAEYNEIDDLTAVLTIETATFDSDSIVFSNKSVTYDGESHSIEVSNVPSGTSISYTYNGNSVTGVKDVGTYSVVATLSLVDYETTTLTATLTIESATLDLDSVEFKDKKVTYDGESHSIEASNVPSGSSVSYTYNGNSVTGVTDAGIYSVVATFTLDNYTTKTLTATLTISSKDLDLTDISLSSDKVQFDGYTHSITVSDLPEGASVSYTYNGVEATEEKSVGTYTVIATVTNSSGNYSEVSTTLTATLEITETTDYSYSISSDDEVYLTGYSGTETDITTPKEICVDDEVYSVVGLGSYAFYNSDITSIVISEGVTEIQYLCFYNCDDLLSVQIPSSIDTLGEQVFYYCTSLETVEISSGLTSLSWECFGYCYSLTSVTLPDTLTSLSQQCFAYCTSLETITIPSSVTSIGTKCFEGDTALTDVYFEDLGSSWYYSTSNGGTDNMTSVSNSNTNATYFTSTYYNYYWTKVSD